MRKVSEQATLQETRKRQLKLTRCWKVKRRRWARDRQVDLIGMGCDSANNKMRSRYGVVVCVSQDDFFEVRQALTDCQNLMDLIGLVQDEKTHAWPVR